MQEALSIPTTMMDGQTDRWDEKNMFRSEEERHNYTKGKLLQVKYPVYSEINRCTKTMLY